MRVGKNTKTRGLRPVRGFPPFHLANAFCQSSLRPGVARLLARSLRNDPSFVPSARSPRTRKLPRVVYPPSPSTGSPSGDGQSEQRPLRRVHNTSKRWSPPPFAPLLKGSLATEQTPLRRHSFAASSQRIEAKACSAIRKPPFRSRPSFSELFLRKPNAHVVARRCASCLRPRPASARATRPKHRRCASGSSSLCSSRRVLWSPRTSRASP